MSNYLLIVVTAHFSCLALAAGSIILSFRHSLQAWLGACYFLVAALYTTCAVLFPDHSFVTGLPLSIIPYFGCASIVWFRWMFLLSVLEDDFQMAAWRFVPLLLLVPAYFAHFWFADTGYSAVATWALLVWYLAIFCLDGNVLFKAYFSLRNDLVEFRRKFRKAFVLPLLIIVTGFNLSAFVGLLFEPQSGLASDNLEESMIITLVLTVWLCIWIMVPGRHDLFRPSKLQEGAKGPAGSGANAINEPKAQVIKTASNAPPGLADSLTVLMGQEEIFKEQGLTLDDLAHRLDVKPYILRQFINRDLGYRNFPAFLRQFRIRAACDALADPDRADIRVIEIALDSGYGSLAPFNRAFRETMGRTPTEFRQEALNCDSASSGPDVVSGVDHSQGPHAAGAQVPSLLLQGSRPEGLNRSR